MPGGYSFDTAEQIRTNNLYYNSKYKTGQFDARGFRKFFYNIVKPTCDIATKFIDLDTKDIILVPTKAQEELKVWAMERRLRHWLKETRFGVTINEGAMFLPYQGHIVWKKVGKEWKNVFIENLRTDPGARWLKDSSFVYEIHTMSASEIRSMNWNGAVDQLLDKELDSYIVYECYTRDGNGWKRTIKSDIFDRKHGYIETPESQINDENEFLPALTLDERSAKLPYREHKWEDVPGRWMGRGFVEYLEDNQVAINEAENLERKGLMFTSLKLYQTRDQNIGGSNVLTDAENGDIFTVTDEVQPVAVEERNLPAFNNTRANWNDNTERKTFTSDITTGGNLPSRTPLGVANLQASLASSFFELKREGYGMFIKDIVANDVIPDFKNDNRKEHILTFVGSDDEIGKIDKMVTEHLVNKASVDHAMKTGFFPSQLQREDARQRIQDQVNRQRNRYLKVPKDFYETSEYFLDVLVTGESIDTGAQRQVVREAIELLNANPAMLQNRTMRDALSLFMSLGGVSPVKLNMLFEDIDQNVPAQGGSVAAPQTSQAPQPTNQVV